MNKKSITGLIIFLAGFLIDCFGICVMLLSMSRGAQIAETWYGQLLDGWFCMLIGPVLLFMGIIVILVGNFIVCKCFRAKPKAQPETALQPENTVPVAPGMNTPPVAPATYAQPVSPFMAGDEKNLFAPKAPLAMTTVTYIFCGNCGTRNGNDGSFCSGCGQRL